MNRQRILSILRLSLEAMGRRNPTLPPLPIEIREDMTLASLGIVPATGIMLSQEMLLRLGIPLNIYLMLTNQFAVSAVSPSIEVYTRVSHLVDHVQSSVDFRIPAPKVVYVDDEEENLFVFKRRFQSQLNLVTFQSPELAIPFILEDLQVVLVITDEVMPGMSGNQLRDYVHVQKPFLKFILITGNPGHDNQLMFNSLSGNRFFGFFEKPLDLEHKAEEYFSVFQKVLSGEYF